MKTKSLLFLLILIFQFSVSNAQNKAREKDIIGNWKLVIEIDKALKESKDQLNQENEFLGSLIISSVSGLVESLIDEIDVYLSFKKNGVLIINVEAFGETDEEIGTWSIDKNGTVIISDTEHIQTDKNNWILKDGLLVSEDSDEEKYVYMVNLD